MVKGPSTQFAKKHHFDHRDDFFGLFADRITEHIRITSLELAPAHFLVETALHFGKPGGLLRIAR